MFQTPGTIKLFVTTKNKKYGENVASLEVVEEILVQCFLIDSMQVWQHYEHFCNDY